MKFNYPPDLDLVARLVEYKGSLLPFYKQNKIRVVKEANAFSEALANGLAEAVAQEAP